MVAKMGFQVKLCICCVILIIWQEQFLTYFWILRKTGDPWPTRIRVDRGVKNVLVCDAMVQFQGEVQGSFITGPSTHNQQIEHLWRAVY